MMSLVIRTALPQVSSPSHCAPPVFWFRRHIDVAQNIVSRPSLHSTSSTRTYIVRWWLPVCFLCYRAWSGLPSAALEGAQRTTGYPLDFSLIFERSILGILASIDAPRYHRSIAIACAISVCIRLNRPCAPGRCRVHEFYSGSRRLAHTRVVDSNGVASPDSDTLRPHPHPQPASCLVPD